MPGAGPLSPAWVATLGMLVSEPEPAGTLEMFLRGKALFPLGKLDRQKLKMTLRAPSGGRVASEPKPCTPIQNGGLH